MAVINIPDEKKTITSENDIRYFLSSKGIFYDRWTPAKDLGPEATQDEVLASLEIQLRDFMNKGGYTTADVISVYSHTPDIAAIRKKFLAEHTHSEDEIRYFVDGQGLFWFNLEKGTPVFSILCEKEDIISVPSGTKHWFDLGPEPHVRAIRIFLDQSGWIPHYTGSEVDKRYNPSYD